MREVSAGGQEIWFSLVKDTLLLKAPYVGYCFLSPGDTRYGYYLLHYNRLFKKLAINCHLLIISCSFEVRNLAWLRLEDLIEIHVHAHGSGYKFSVPSWLWVIGHSSYPLDLTIGLLECLCQGNWLVLKWEIGECKEDAAMLFMVYSQESCIITSHVLFVSAGLSIPAHAQSMQN